MNADDGMDPARYALGEVVPKPYFFGVHPNGLRTPEFADPFVTDGWMEHCRRAAGRLGIREGKPLADPHLPRWQQAASNVWRALRSPALANQWLGTGGALNRHLLPVASMIHDVELRRGRVRVLDVGGGFGDNFFKLLRLLRRETIAVLDYHVVDSARSCALGAELYAGYAVKPTFHSDLTNSPAANDIVLMIGTLQYIGDWSPAMAAAAKSSERYFYIARTPMTSGEGFVTIQLVCPTLGSMAGRNLGPTLVNVLALRALQEAMTPPWNPMFEFKDVDYSAQFTRLPPSHRDVAYYNVGWQRPGP